MKVSECVPFAVSMVSPFMSTRSSLSDSVENTMPSSLTKPMFLKPSARVVSMSVGAAVPIGAAKK